MRNAERVGRCVCLTLLGSLAFVLAGCGGDSGSGATSSTSSTIPTTVAATAPTTGGTSSHGSSSSITLATAPAISGSSVTFDWVPTAENNDGTPITDLAGYKIHYGTEPQDYEHVVAVDNPGLSRYVLDNLSSGTYYFAIAAYDTRGIESELSGEISATLLN